MKLKYYCVGDEINVEEINFDNFPKLDEEKGNQALRDCLLIHRTNKRQGNSSTKTRSEINKTGKKAWRQKGTGMARHGSKSSPIWVGGGVAFGPKPKDYRKNINKKVKNLAFKRALINSAKKNYFKIVKCLEFDKVKTKDVNKILSKLCPDGKILLVDKEFDENFYLSVRNIKRVYTLNANELSIWELMLFKQIFITKTGFNCILDRMSK